ncbi:MAG: histidinol-phosphatase [Gammaproteobacteria bacterium]
MNVPPHEDFAQFAHRLAEAAGAVILPYFRARLQVDSKGDGRNFDPVTAADRAAERMMRDMIAGRYPQHGILGEEFGIENGEAALRWVLDPIDGTRAFISGLPLWGTLIALCEGNEPIVGCMNQPYLDERFLGTADGAFMHMRGVTSRIVTRPCATPADAVLYATDPAMFRQPGERAAFDRVAAQARLTRFGGDCYAYCMLAAGQIDLIVEADLKFYDIAALIPIIERAGGIVTDWQGRRAFDSGRVVAAGDVRCHAAALELLGG